MIVLALVAGGQNWLPESNSQQQTLQKLLSGFQVSGSTYHN